MQAAFHPIAAPLQDHSTGQTNSRRYGQQPPIFRAGVRAWLKYLFEGKAYNLTIHRCVRVRCVTDIFSIGMDSGSEQVARKGNLEDLSEVIAKQDGHATLGLCLGLPHLEVLISRSATVYVGLCSRSGTPR